LAQTAVVSRRASAPSRRIASSAVRASAIAGVY